MKNQRRFGMAALVLAGSLLTIGCGPKRPLWIEKSGGAFKTDKKMIYGVGIAEGIQSEALRRTTADNRAINEVSRQVAVLSNSLMRDYMASAAVPAEAKGNEEQYVENTVKTLTSNVLSGVKITDRYQDKNALYSLAALNVEDLKSLAEQVSSLSAGVKEHIKANAEKAFEKLSEEQTKEK